MPPKRKAAGASTTTTVTRTSTRTIKTEEPGATAEAKTTRQKKAADVVEEPSTALEEPKKRGRVAKATSVPEESDAVEEPTTTRGRGRAAKAKQEETAPTATKARGRGKNAAASKPKDVEVEVEAVEAEAQLQEEAQEAVGKADDDDDEGAEEAPVPKKRGRPAGGATKTEPTPSTAATGRGRRAAATKEADAVVAPVPRARGRPKKEETAEAPKEPASSKPRGRPKKDESAGQPAPEPKTQASGRGKRKATAVEEAPTDAPAKKTRGRPAKTNAAKAKAETSTEDETVSEPPTKKRGRPSKSAEQNEHAAEPDQVADATDHSPKKRGRPSKGDAGATTTASATSTWKPRGRPRKSEPTETDESDVPATSTPKARGRPRKSEPTEADESEVPASKKRGRPAKAATDVGDDTPKRPASDRKPATSLKKRGRPSNPTPRASASATPAGTGRKPGRPRVSFEPDVVPSPAPGSGRRGRPPKQAAPVDDEELDEDEESEERPSKRARRGSAKVSTEGGKSSEMHDDEMQDAPAEDAEMQDVAPEVNGHVEAADEHVTPARQRVSKKAPKTAPAKKREGTRASSRRLSSPGAASKKTNAGTDHATLPLNADHEDEGPKYWLLKAEPESRIEKGKDLKFSIDDLKNATKPEPWTGVRNYGARNNMMAMKVGEKAFFYHSSCKRPGVVGIMEIVSEATPDLSAFDKNDSYYDAKSSEDKPKWFNVHVEFRQKFDDFSNTSLEELKKYAEGPLANMQLFKQGRLSVTKVTKAEWNFILNLAGHTEYLADVEATEPHAGEVSEVLDATAAAEPDSELIETETAGHHESGDVLEIGQEAILSAEDALEELNENLATAIEDTIEEFVDQIAEDVAAEVSSELSAAAEEEIQEELREELAEQITEQVVESLHNGPIAEIVSKIEGPAEIVASATFDINAPTEAATNDLSELPDASILVQHTIEITEEAADAVPALESGGKRRRQAPRRSSRAPSQPRSRRSSRAPSLPAVAATPAKHTGSLVPPATVPHSVTARMAELAAQPMSDPAVPIATETIIETYTEVEEIATTGGGGRSYGMDLYVEDSTTMLED